MRVNRRPPLTKMMRSSRNNGLLWPQAGLLPGSPPARSTRLSRRKQQRSVTLVHGADKSTALPGDTVIFTAWITNDSRSHLRNIRLIPRSFTNEAMEPLVYSSSPDHNDLSVSSLAPGETVMRSFSYRVKESDHIHGGSLVSAMQVRALCLGHQVGDEHDAIVSLSGTQADWPFQPARLGLGYWKSTAVRSVSPRRRPSSAAKIAD